MPPTNPLGEDTAAKGRGIRNGARRASALPETLVKENQSLKLEAVTIACSSPPAQGERDSAWGRRGGGPYRQGAGVGVREGHRQGKAMLAELIR